MFFFFIGGVQPQIKKVLQANYGPCLNCRTGMMDHVEMAQTLYAFFLPVYSFSKQNLLHCKDCGFSTTPENYRTLQQDPSSLLRSTSANAARATKEISCLQCGSPVSNGWSFCPNCGRQINNS